MEKVKLSPPWVTYYREVHALFKDDPEISISFDIEQCILKLRVENADKADALTKLLPAEKEFGNVTLKIIVVPANMQRESKISLFRRAFSGNPIVKDIEVIDDVFENSVNYIIFDGSIVQFYNDELCDFHGMKTLLCQDVAKDVFGEHDGIFFCTELIDK